MSMMNGSEVDFSLSERELAIQKRNSEMEAKRKAAEARKERLSKNPDFTSWLADELFRLGLFRPEQETRANAATILFGEFSDSPEVWDELKKNAMKRDNREV